MKWAAFDAPTTSHANNDRITPFTEAAPAQRRYFVPHLHEAWPRIIGELNFNDRLIARDRHSACNSDDARLGKRRVLNTVRILIGQSAGHAEYAAFRIRNIFAPHYDLRIAIHLFTQSPIDGFHHRDRVL